MHLLVNFMIRLSMLQGA